MTAEAHTLEGAGTFQDAFIQALQAPPDSPWPEALAHLCAQPGFAVYRNTVMKSCIDALEASYPSIARMVGTEWFRAAAALYARAHPATDPRLLHYGEHFAHFLANFEPAKAYPYLPCIAQLDAAWVEAHVAADAPALTSAELIAQAQSPERLHLKPHPAARWLHHPEHPIDTLWQRARAHRDEDAALVWQGEATLITRPGHEVQWVSWSEAGCAFLTACAAGELFEQACAEALRVDPALDVGALVASLLEAGALQARGDAAV
jgi:hypothetical protein